jgi:hypothetical protein
VNKELLFAADLERNTLAELKRILENAPSIICPVLDMLIAAEEGWNDVFKLLENNERQYPIIEAKVLTGLDNEWTKVIATLKEVQFENADILLLLWMLHAAVERTMHYYQQAAANSAYPAQRQFFTSLVQCKLLMKKRLDSIMRIMYNHAWAEIGFAPFVLGKD